MNHLHRLFWLAVSIAAAWPFDVAPAAEPADPNEVFSIVLLPDTQFYSQKYPETYVAQTMWIRERVRLLGGAVDTGPGARGGFALIARIPIGASL